VFIFDLTPFVKCVDPVSNVNVLVAAIVPPPDKPLPAVIETAV